MTWQLAGVSGVWITLSRVWCTNSANSLTISYNFAKNAVGPNGRHTHKSTKLSRRGDSGVFYKAVQNDFGKWEDAWGIEEKCTGADL